MDKMDMLRLDIAEKLCEIEDILKEWGLDSMTGITLVARDPDNPDMSIILSNGGENELQKAADLLVSNLEEISADERPHSDPA